MNRIRAAKTKFRVTPARSNVNVGRPVLLRAMKNTSMIVRKAPTNAATDMIGTPKTTRFRPNRIASTAPNELPLETPSVKGVASEFRNIAWNRTPATASAPPTIAPKSTRGMRAMRKISRSGETPARTPRIEILLAPIHGATRMTRANITTHVPTTETNRPHDSEGLSAGNDVRTAAVGTLEDGCMDFEDVIQIVRSQYFIR